MDIIVQPLQRVWPMALNSGDAEAIHQYFLSVLFPADELQILDYNRVVKDLNNMTVDALEAALKKDFEVTKLASAQKPAHSNHFSMYVDGQWYALKYKRPIESEDPIANLAITILHSAIIAPLLGIDDPRADKRIDFIGGARGLQELERLVDTGEMAIAFALFPTSIQELIAVSDNDEVMPPKSTWFEPKLLDGLVSLKFN